MLSKTHLRAGAGLALALGLTAATVPALGGGGSDAAADRGVVALAASEPQVVSFADGVAAAPATLADATEFAAEAVTEHVAAEQAAQIEAYAAAIEAAELEAYVAAVEAAQLEAYVAAVEAAQLEAYVAALAADQARQAAAAPAAPAGSVESIIQRHFGAAAPTAIRVARCESSLNPRAVSPGGGNHGLFQINNVHRGTFESVTGAPWSAVYDAETNTRFAHWLYRQSGWGPWACA